MQMNIFDHVSKPEEFCFRVLIIGGFSETKTNETGTYPLEGLF